MSAPLHDREARTFVQQLLSYFDAVKTDTGLDATRRFVPRDDVASDELALVDRINEVVERLQVDLISLARLANEMSTSAASNSFLIARIATAAQRQFEETDALASAVEETARGSEAVASSAVAARELTQTLRERSGTSFAAMERALARLDELRSGAQETAKSIASVADSSKAIVAMVDVIDDISQATNLLGINAAIEAAHAGDAGRGFGVVADEIKRLADSTRASTKQIAVTIKEVQRSVDRATQAARTNAEHVATVGDEAGTVRDDLDRMATVIGESSDQISTIATTVEQQSAVLQSVASSVKALSENAQSGAESTQMATLLKLDQLNRSTFAIISRYELGTFLDRLRSHTIKTAEEVEAAIEAALVAHKVSATDIFDTTYTEVTGVEVQKLSRIFDVSLASREGFKPPKYRTRWDAALDAAFMDVVDRAVDTLREIDFSAIVDINGFLTMHAAQYRKAITGDYERDLIGNRIKRIFDDPVGLRAGRVGLHGGDLLAKLAPRGAFATAHVDLHRPAGQRPLLLQSYARDTGVVLNDLSAPIYVRGEHWGAVRVAFDPAILVRLG